MREAPRIQLLMVIAAFVAGLIACQSAWSKNNALPPQMIRSAPANESSLVLMPDGTVKCFYMVMGKQVESITSNDDGETWGEPVVEIPLPGLRTHHACRTLVDRHGEVHVWFVVHVDRKQEPQRAKMALDVWHCKTTKGIWDVPRRIFVGYVGAIRGALQMRNGRIVVPFGVWNDSEPLSRHGPSGTGNHFVTTIYSDDDGNTWKLSDTLLTAPVNKNYNGNNYGAIEPDLVQLKDGRLWMVMRTQTGYLYESYSRDGENWSSAKATRFPSSNSPASLCRLNDESILLVWNNAQMPKRIGRQMLYAGRDVLHAAITRDEGETWHGFREVYRDPTRNERPPARGDRGTAYPSMAQGYSGKVILVTGQGERNRAILRLSPDWLLADNASSSLSADFQDWIFFKEFGKPYGIFLDRKPGPQMIKDGLDRSRPALILRKPIDTEIPDVAIWNFPACQSGRLILKVKFQRDSEGIIVSLTDRFYNPGDPAGISESPFQYPFSSQLTPFTKDSWYEVELRWNLDRKICHVLVEGKAISQLSPQRSSKNGLSYLRIASAAENVDSEGVKIADVRMAIEK